MSVDHPVDLDRVRSFLATLPESVVRAKGVLDTKDILYYVNFTVLGLFLTLRSLESRRWSG